MSISSHRSEQSSSKNLQITNAQEGVEKKEHFYTTGKCKLIHPLWRTVLKLLKKKKKKKPKNLTTIAKRKCQVMSNSRDPMNYSLPGSSAHGILQGRILE